MGSDDLTFNFILPENSTQLSLIDVDYRHSSFDFTLSAKTLKIVMTREGNSGMTLTAGEKIYKLKVNEILVLTGTFSGKITEDK